MQTLRGMGCLKRILSRREPDYRPHSSPEDFAPHLRVAVPFSEMQLVFEVALQ